jgi:hypothetical protein
MPSNTCLAFAELTVVIQVLAFSIAMVFRSSQ